jgi:hypothetical protein
MGAVRPPLSRARKVSSASLRLRPLTSLPGVDHLLEALAEDVEADVALHVADVGVLGLGIAVQHAVLLVEGDHLLHGRVAQSPKAAKDIIT